MLQAWRLSSMAEDEARSDLSHSLQPPMRAWGHVCHPGLQHQNINEYLHQTAMWMEQETDYSHCRLSHVKQYVEKDTYQPVNVLFLLLSSLQIPVFSKLFRKITQVHTHTRLSMCVSKNSVLQDNWHLEPHPLTHLAGFGAKFSCHHLFLSIQVSGCQNFL